MIGPDAAHHVRRREILTDDGVRLVAHLLGDPAAPPALLVPGTFSNHTFWLGTRGTGFARAIAAAGFHAWVLDPRGHGASQRATARDRWNFDHWSRHDVPAAVRAASDAAGPGVVLVGHSAGGAATLIAAAAHPELRVRAIVVIATPVPWLQGFRRTTTRIVRRGSLLLGRFPARLLRLGPEDELPGVMAQWMSWNLHGHWTGDDGTDYVARIRELPHPTLFVAGAGDHVEAPPHAVHALYELAGSFDKTFLLCGRGTGFSADFDHSGLVVSRAARAEVWPKIMTWLASTLGRE